jgi:hypothetical protein
MAHFSKVLKAVVFVFFDIATGRYIDPIKKTKCQND